MKKIVIILLLFYGLTSFAQPKSDTAVSFSEALCPGDRLEFEDYSVKFCEVVVDSRCPKGVTCIRAGEVRVKLEFFKGNKSIGSKIISSSGISLAEMFGTENLEVNRFMVSPYPDIHTKIQPEDYRLWLKITDLNAS